MLQDIPIQLLDRTGLRTFICACKWAVFWQHRTLVTGHVLLATTKVNEQCQYLLHKQGVDLVKLRTDIKLIAGQQQFLTNGCSINYFVVELVSQAHIQATRELRTKVNVKDLLRAILNSGRQCSAQCAIKRQGINPEELLKCFA